MGAQAANRTSVGSAPAAARAWDRSAAPEGSEGERCPLGCRQHTGPAQLPTCTGHNSLFQPWLWEGKVRVLCASPISSTRGGQASPREAEGKQDRDHPAQLQCPQPRLLEPLQGCSLLITRLAPWPGTQGEGPGGGSSTARFPLCRQGISFVRSRGWCIPVQSSSCIAAMAAAPSRVRRTSVPRHRGSSWDRVLVLTGVQGAVLCLEEPGRERCMCRVTPRTSTAIDTSSPGHHTGFI